MSEEKIIEKLNEHDKRFDAHDKRFDAHDKRFDKLESILDKHAETLIEHGEQLKDIKSKMATKQDIDEVMQSQDEMLTILKRADQERVFTTERVKRLERDVEENTLDIKQIKDQLNIV